MPVGALVLPDIHHPPIRGQVHMLQGVGKLLSPIPGSDFRPEELPLEPQRVQNLLVDCPALYTGPREAHVVLEIYERCVLPCSRPLPVFDRFVLRMYVEKHNAFCCDRNFYPE